MEALGEVVTAFVAVVELSPASAEDLPDFGMR